MASEAARLDAESPWPWLDPFTENASGVFGGRDEDVRALLRGVLAAPVCVLFGRSGLGKTSLLLAGLFPVLRVQRFLPVAVRRLEYGPAAPPVSAQLHRALDAAAADAELGWRESISDADDAGGVAALWERLHGRDQQLVDRHRRRWTPVFVLDQLEEVFTLEPDEARRRALFHELGDLLENRVPPAVAARIERDEALLDRIDLDTQPYRFLLALREDFLPDLEYWTDLIPRLGPNRYRLLPLSDRGALEAIRKTGGTLVDAASAQTIVDFLGRQASQGVRARDDRRIEPALLSLVCASLNADRLGTTPPASQLDVSNLETRGAQILDRFYDDAFAAVDEDARPRVELFVETNLITPGGSRRPYPSEAVDPSLRPALAVLERRRLLRTEVTEQGDQIELVHDRLAGVALQRAMARQRRTAEAEHLQKEKEAAETEVLKQRAALAELADARARAEAARADDLAQANRRFRNAMVGAIVVAIAALAMAGVAGYQKQLADAERLRAVQATVEAETQTAQAQVAKDALGALLPAAQEALQRAAATGAVNGATQTSEGDQLLAQAYRSYASASADFQQLQGCPSGRRVYPHIAQNSDRTVLDEKLIPALRAAGFVVPGVQRMPPEPMPLHGELRYFRSNEVAGAEGAVAAITAAGLTDVSAKLVKGYENSTTMRPCHYELWLARPSESSAPAAGNSTPPPVIGPLPSNGRPPTVSVDPTAEILRMLAPTLPLDRASEYAAALAPAMRQFAINTPVRAAAFLATIAFETAGFRSLEESLDYRNPERLDMMFTAVKGVEHAKQLIDAGPAAIANVIYANKLGNGDAESGDGYRYRSRGFIGVFGRVNYARLGLQTGKPYLDEPDLLAQPENAAFAASWIWNDRHANAAADANDFEQVVAAINGPAKLGLAERQVYWQKARAAYGLDAK